MFSRIPRTPTILQMEAVECGAAALGIVLGHHGRRVPLVELRERCGVSREGTNAANMVRAAGHYGLAATGLSVDVAGLRTVSLPAIVFWKFNHFVVLEGWSRRGVHINDPASGRRRLTEREFDEGFTGVVLELAPAEGFRRGGPRTNPAAAIRRRLRRAGRDLAFAVAAGLLLVVPALAATMLTQLFVDGVLIEGHRDWLRPLLLGLLVAGAFRVAIRALQLRYLRLLRARLALRLSAEFAWHVLRLPLGFFSQRYAGEIARRATLNDGIADVLAGRLAAAAIDTLMVGAYVAVMFFYDVPLTLVALALVTFNAVALRSVARRRADANARLRVEEGKGAALEIAGLQNLSTLKASARESGFFVRWAGQYTRTAMARQELAAGSRFLGVLPALSSSLTIAAVLVVGGFGVIEGRLTLGMLIAFQLLCGLLQGPVGTLVGLFSQLQTLLGDMQRTDDVLTHDEDPEAAPREDAAAMASLRGALELRDVSFGYDPNTPPLIESFDLTLEPGRRVALVGGSGSGKSTVARLVSGLLTPWSGQVLLDGSARREIPREILARDVALVDQDIRLFAGTVSDNLTLWDGTLPQDAVLRATRDAEIHRDILALPGGYGALLDEDGRNLSGGQRQRLEIARALVRDPSLLVLDEATSALDTETEARIDGNLRARGCAMLIVAHRLSTVRDADEILVLDGGRVVERGDHATLWAARGAYRRLVDDELGGEAA